MVGRFDLVLLLPFPLVVFFFAGMAFSYDRRRPGRALMGKKLARRIRRTAISFAESFARLRSVSFALGLLRVANNFVRNFEWLALLRRRFA
jgi:hypothetical protein